MTERADALAVKIEQLGWAVGTLKTAVSTVRVTDGVKGCEEPLALGVESARQQIVRLRQLLDSLESLLTPA